jgi:hypothetical protein
MKNHVTTIAALATLITAAGIASADDDAAAAYARGQRALKAGRVHEACTAFEDSHKLEAKLETEQSLAECYEQDGKPIAAARLYRTIAEKESSADRSKKAIARADKLEAKAPRLRFAINPRPAGLVIKVDGVEVPSTGDVRVDVGPHEVVATAPGYEGHASTAIDRDRQIVDVILRMEAKAEPAVEKPAMKTEPKQEPKAEPKAEPTSEPKAEPKAEPMTAPAQPMTESSGGHRKRNGYIAGAVGLGMIGGSIAFFAAGSSKYTDERRLCPGFKCKTDADLAAANDLISDGRTLRGVSYGMGIAGGLLVAAGVYLVMTDHKERPRISLNVDHESAGLTFTGSF